MAITELESEVGGAGNGYLENQLRFEWTDAGGYCG